MFIKKGGKRIVLIFGRWVIKFPNLVYFSRINSKKNLIISRKFFSRYSVLAIKLPSIIFARPLKGMAFLKSNVYFNLLFGAIAHNWVEFVFYWRYKFFVAPTYFSFFGLINVCKRANVVKIDGEEVREMKKIPDQIKKIIGFNSFVDSLPEVDKFTAMDIAHEFYNPKNFGEVDGRLVLVDYADSRTQIFIKKYGEKISENFRFTNASQQGHN